MSAVPEPLILAPEAANLLGVPVSTIYAMSRTGRIHTVRIGRAYRYSPEALREFVRAGGTGAQNAQQPVEAGA